MTAEFARTIAADSAEIPGMLDAIEAWLEEAGVPMAELARIMIAFDEIMSNIANHGGGTIEVMIGTDTGAMRATVADDGPPFDPLARPAPDIGLDIDDRAIGGLGIHLVREMMDEVSYTHENGRNRLTFRKTY